jgi:hypothetical protein
VISSEETRKRRLGFLRIQLHWISSMPLPTYNSIQDSEKLTVISLKKQEKGGWGF